MARASYQNLNHVTLGGGRPVVRLVRRSGVAVHVPLPVSNVAFASPVRVRRPLLSPVYS